MSEINYPESVDKIQDFVTRPREEVKDTDGKGHFSISPLGFPNTNVSGDANPTRITPVFKATYKDARSYLFGGDPYSENEEIGVLRNNFAQDGASSNTIILDINASSVTDFYKYNSVRIISGSGVGEVKGILSYDGSTKEATVDSTWTTTPDATSVFIILVREETAQSGNSNDITLDVGANPTDDVYNGFVVRIASGTGIGQSRVITDYVGSTQLATVDRDWVVTPDNTSVFILIEAQKYKWDGTENDNKLGVYLDDNLDPKVDPITGKEINHLRKTYSDIEVANYLRLALDPSFRMGRAGDGTLFRWLMGTSLLNIGTGPASTVIPVEPFGANRVTCIPRTTGPVNLRDRLAVSQKRKELRRQQRHTNWLLSNTHSTDDTYKGLVLKDYPYVYNSEYIPDRVNIAQGGTDTSIFLDAGASAADDAYITANIEILSGTGFGQSRTIVDYIGATREAIVSEEWQLTPDNTSEFRITFITQGANLLYNAVDLYRISVNNSVTPDLQPLVIDAFFYQRDNSYHNNITLDLNEKTMYGRHHISILHTFGVDEEFNFNFDDKKKIVDQLDLIDPQIIRKETLGTIVKYYYKRRLKRSITDFVAFPTAPSSTGVQYELDFPNPGDLTIHLDPGTNNLDYTYISGNFSASEKLTHLQNNHDFLPGVIDVNDLTYNLEGLFSHNTIIDLVDVDNIYKQKKIRSKKTFVHLPTKNINDGAVCELDVSLPVDSGEGFFNNTIGVMSGYKNYITQPRVYVLSGYSLKVGDFCNLDVGLTEKKNPYLFSPNPEVEYAESGSTEPDTANVFHQRKMVTEDIFGNKYIRKMVFLDAGYVDADESDIGKTILGNTSGDKAILLNFDNDSKMWVIRLVNNAQFNLSELVTIINGLGSGTTSGAVVDPIEEDKRVLIATVYPTSTNTFGWRLDKDPSLKLMHWSILSNSQFNESSTFLAYKRNKDIVAGISAGSFSSYGLFDFTVREWPLSYKNDFLNLGDFAQYISSHVRLLYPPKLVPDDSNDLISPDDLVYALHSNQCSKAFNELMRDFYKSRVRLDLRNSMSDLDNEQQQIGFNNSTLSSPPALSADYSSGFMVFNNTEFPNNSHGNAQRWMTKPKDLPKYIFQAFTLDFFMNVFDNTSTAFKNYMEPYFVPDKPTETDAANLYIPGTLYPSIFPSYAFGAGPQHHLVTSLVNKYNYIIDNNIFILDPEGFQIMFDDARRRMWQSSFDIDYGSNEHPGKNRKFDKYDFRSSVVNDDSYFRKFYGMLWSPFARVVDLNSVVPSEHSIDCVENLDVIKANSSYDQVQRTLINYVKSNPIAEKYYRLNHQTSDGKSLDSEHMKMSKIVGIHDSVTDLAPLVPDFFNNTKDEFVKNYISPHANKMVNRFYNSYRILLTGNQSSIGMYDLSDGVENFDNERTFKTMAYSYLNNVVDNPEIHTSVDDDYLLLDDGGPKVRAEDFNMAWSFFDNGVGKRQNTAQSGGSFTITLDAGASSINDFYKDNILKIVSGTGSGQCRTITTYDGSTKVATVDVDWNVTPDNTSMFFIDTQVRGLINVSGEQFLFKKGFYDSKGKKSYIRVKMKFIYSKKMGRWVTLDYRQSPITYLTPTFGNVALSRKEKTTVFPGLSGKDRSEYVPFIIPDTANAVGANVRQNARNILEYSTDFPSSIFIGQSNVITYVQKIPNLLTSPQDPARYLVNKILHNIVTHNVNTQEWSDQNVNYTVNQNVLSRGVVYRVTTTHTTSASTVRPEYNNSQYQVRQAPVLYAPFWNDSTKYASGQYVRFGNFIYIVNNTTIGFPSPDANSNFTQVETIIPTAPIWQNNVTYNKGDLVKYNNVFYEVITPTSFGNPTPNTNPNFAVYSKFIGYAQDWDASTQYKVGDVVFFNSVSYKVISGTPLGAPTPDSNSSFSPLHEFYKNNQFFVELDEYVFVLRDFLPDNFTSFVYIAPSINTITSISTPYPWNSISGSVYKDLLWQHEDSKCVQSPLNTPYHKMKPMRLNRFCIPFLSNKLPYDNNGLLLTFLNGDHDLDLNMTYATDPGPSQFEDYAENPAYSVGVVHVTENNGTGIDRDIWIATDTPNKGVKRKTGGPVSDNYSSLIDLQTATGDGAVRKDATGIDTDASGNVYFAAKKLVKCDPNGTSFSVVTGSGNLVTPPTGCTKIHIDKTAGLVFVVGNDGLFVYDISQNKWVKKFNSGNSILHPTGGNDLHQGPDGTIWIISINAGDLIYKYVYPNNSLTSETTIFGSKHQLVKACVRVAANGDVFVGGGTQGLYPSFSRRDFSSGQWIITDLPSGATPFNIRIDNTQTTWIATAKGLFRFISDGNFDILDTPDGLHFDGDLVYGGNLVLSLAVDSANNIWIGGFFGFLYYRRFATTTYADYTLQRLANPHLDEISGGINFVVPNNVYGGKQDPNPDLFLFQPHMFKVYWHIRPVVSAYEGTDIPSPTARTGGTVSDPCLANMFNFPKLPISTDSIIPWHSDMSKNWFNDDAFNPIPGVNILDIDENDAEEVIDETDLCGEGGNNEIFEV